MRFPVRVTALIPTWCVFWSLFFALPSEAQTIITPEVEVSLDALPKQDAARLTHLEDYLRYALSSYTLPSGVSIVPKVPVRIRVQVVFLPEVSHGGDLLCDLLLTAYRPIYENDDRETVVFSALDKKVPCTPTLTQELPNGSNGFPTVAFLVRMHRLVTMGLLMYYDSFSVEGGTSFLNSLRTHDTDYAKSIDSDNTSLATSTLSFTRIPDEMGTEEGGIFRELWVLHHLEVLDSNLETRESLETFIFVLRKWSEVMQSGKVPGLIQLLRDTKSGDVEALLKKTDNEYTARAMKYIPSLFPSLVIDKKSLLVD